MYFKKRLLPLMLLVSGVSQADSLTLTCDFKYDEELGAYYEIPADCIHALKKTLKSKMKDNYPRELPREYLVLANPPACPTGYKDMNIYQGGVIASSQYRTRFKPLISKYYYQVRRICLKD